MFVLFSWKGYKNICYKLMGKFPYTRNVPSREIKNKFDSPESTLNLLCRLEYTSSSVYSSSKSDYAPSWAI